MRIAVAGAGLIGRRHIEELVKSPHASLASIIDPSPEAGALAAELGVPHYATLERALADDRPDGVILATPNRLHVEGGLTCIAAGVPVIVEKPLAETAAGAKQLVEAAEAAHVPLLTGHHRNYSANMAAAREVISSGVLGRLVAIVGQATFYKPDDYFDVGDGWRRKAGGGPILLNLTHEVNNLMALAGDITAVQATTSSATRGFEVEVHHQNLSARLRKRHGHVDESHAPANPTFERIESYRVHRPSQACARRRSRKFAAWARA